MDDRWSSRAWLARMLGEVVGRPEGGVLPPVTDALVDQLVREIYAYLEGSSHGGEDGGRP